MGMVDGGGDEQVVHVGVKLGDWGWLVRHWPVDDSVGGSCLGEILELGGRGCYSRLRWRACKCCESWDLLNRVGDMLDDRVGGVLDWVGDMLNWVGGLLDRWVGYWGGVGVGLSFHWLVH